MSPHASAGDPGPEATSLATRRLSRSSIVAGIGVAIAALWFIVALPLVADAVHGGGYPADEPFEVAPNLMITAEKGWEYDDSSGLFYIMSRDGMQAIFISPTAADLTLDETAANLISGLDGSGAVITDPEPFTTDSGYDGLVYISHLPNTATATWIIEHDGQQAQVLLTGPDSSLDQVYDDAEALVQSITFAGGTS